MVARAKFGGDELVTAWRLLQLPPPAQNWFSSKGNCKDLPQSELPETTVRLAERNARGRQFIGRYCTACIVQTECRQSMLQAQSEPAEAARGGLMPSEVLRLWAAAEALREAHGDLRAVAAARELFIEMPPGTEFGGAAKSTP